MNCCCPSEVLSLKFVQLERTWGVQSERNNSAGGVLLSATTWFGWRLPAPDPMCQVAQGSQLFAAVLEYRWLQHHWSFIFTVSGSLIHKGYRPRPLFLILHFVKGLYLCFPGPFSFKELSWYVFQILYFLKDFPDLLQGFSIFLPPGHRLPTWSLTKCTFSMLVATLCVSFKQYVSSLAFFCPDELNRWHSMPVDQFVNIQNFQTLKFIVQKIDLRDKCHLTWPNIWSEWQKHMSGSTKRQIQKQKNDSAETSSVQGNCCDITARENPDDIINTRNCQPLTKTKFLTNKMLLV